MREMPKNKAFQRKRLGGDEGAVSLAAAVSSLQAHHSAAMFDMEPPG
jgi:hypothetical protein